MKLPLPCRFGRGANFTILSTDCRIALNGIGCCRKSIIVEVRIACTLDKIRTSWNFSGSDISKWDPNYRISYYDLFFSFCCGDLGDR